MTQTPLEIALGSAVFSECRGYRYRLWRTLLVHAKTSEISSRVTFVALNPSKADETGDDQTVRKCIGFARTWGFARVELVNLFALKSTDPLRLVETEDAVGQDNDAHLTEVFRSSGRIVLAWGTVDRRLRRRVFDRAHRVCALLEEHARCEVGSIGERLADGSPRHPSRIPYALPFRCESVGAT